MTGLRFAPFQTSIIVAKWMLLYRLGFLKQPFRIEGVVIVFADLADLFLCCKM